MRSVGFRPVLLAALFLSWTLPASAQLSPAEPDPLARIRDAANSNVQACSATGETLCEQVAPKIIANAQGDSPLAENLGRLSQEIHDGKVASPAETVDWALATFRKAGVEAHGEENTVPLPGQKTTFQVLHTVVAEIRGRETPDEWVLLGARLDLRSPDTAHTLANAAAVIEAARDIQLTGVHPRRSIRFVLFIGPDNNSIGSWAYVRTHRNELDLARAAIILISGPSRMSGFSLNGRHEIETGLGEAMKPIESLNAAHFSFEVGLATDNFDFLLEGVPTLTAEQIPFSYALDSPPAWVPHDLVEIADLKYNTSVAAVTAFGLAEQSHPVGPRQSHAKIESLLKTTGLDQQMKTAGLWPLWELGERGRLP
jgi:peptidase M28-like protein